MAKVYNLEEYRLKRELREARKDLRSKIEYCDKFGYLWVDHYTIKELHDRISLIVEKIKDVQQRSS